MEIFLLIILLSALLSVLLPLIAVGSCLIGLFYGRSYWSQDLLRKNSPRFRGSALVYAFGQWLFPCEFASPSAEHALSTLKGRQLFFVGHPHGFGVTSPISTMLVHGGMRKFPVENLRVGGSSGLFLCPGLKELAEAAGVFNITHRNLEVVLDAGHDVLIHPGGAQEMLIAHPDADCMDVKTHRGFLKLVFERKLLLIPLFYENEHKRFLTWHPWPALSRWLVKHLRMPGLFFFFPVLHKRITTQIHVCDVIDSKHHESVESLRTAYINAYKKHPFNFVDDDSESKSNLLTRNHHHHTKNS